MNRGRPAGREPQAVRATSAWYAPWTRADDRTILKAANRRIPATEIAIMVGRTPWAVRTRLYTLRNLGGVNARAARKRAREKAVQLTDQGMARREVAARIGVTPPTLDAMLRYARISAGCGA